MTKKQAVTRQAMFTERDIEAIRWAVNRARLSMPKYSMSEATFKPLKQAEQALAKLVDLVPRDTPPPFDAS